MRAMTDPDYGPSGYLPPRQAKRKRKIVLRGQMGLGWPVAAVVAGVVVLLVAVAYLATKTGPPGPPFEPVVAIDRVDPRGAQVVEVDAHELLIVRAGGILRVFLAPGEVVWCPESQRLEGVNGVWTLPGRRTGGRGPSLAPVPAVVFDGRVYAAPSTPEDPGEPLGSDEQPACR